MRNARAVVHVGIANQQWRGKRTRHSRRMRNPHFCITGKRPMMSLKLSTGSRDYLAILRVLLDYVCLCRWDIRHASARSNIAWISNCSHYKMWNEIIYPFPNFNGLWECYEPCKHPHTETHTHVFHAYKFSSISRFEDDLEIVEILFNSMGTDITTEHQQSGYCIYIYIYSYAYPIIDNGTLVKLDFL